VQERQSGQIKPRTAVAIANNREWVDHYEKLVNSLNRPT
jgi:hypothetical protein